VEARPRGPLAVRPGLELNFESRRLLASTAPKFVILNPCRGPVRFDEVGQRHVGEGLVVAVDLAVGGDDDEIAARARVGEIDRVRERVAVSQEMVEADVLRERGVVEEDVDESRGARASGTPARGGRSEAAVGEPDRNRSFRDILPGGFPDRAHTERLMRRKNDELEPVIDEDLERRRVDRRFGEPDPLGLMAEAPLEVVNAPPDLCFLVAPRGERHDDVVVALRDRVPVPAEPGRAQAVRLEYPPVDAGEIILEPREERRPEIEADPFVVVDELRDAAPAVEAARERVREVALVRDAVVPVVYGAALPALDSLRPGIFSGRLVEVPVNDEALGCAACSIEALYPL